MNFYVQSYLKVKNFMRHETERHESFHGWRIIARNSSTDELFRCAWRVALA